MASLKLTRAVAAACAAAALAPGWASPPDITVIEYFHSSTGHYFMTGSIDDQRVLNASPAFAATGRSFAAWSASNSGRPAEATAVSRFFNPATASHVFTSKREDISLLRSLPVTASGGGFADEGTAFFALSPVGSRCDSGQRAIFRGFNNRPDGNHRFSNEIELHASMVSSGFSDDSVAFCATAVGSDSSLEKRAGTPSSTEDLTVSGTVSAFVSLASFKVGTQMVDASNARFDHGSPLALVNSISVTVEGVMIGNVLVATEIKLPVTTVVIEDELKGFVTAVGAAGTIFVNGSAVDVSTAVITGGTLAQLIVGAKVEVHGVLVAGKFVASLVHIEDAASSTTALGQAEIKGVISAFVSLSNFLVAGQKIDASTALIEDGTVASLINGATVEVNGTMVVGVIKATRVELKRAAAAPSPSTTPPPSGSASFETTGAVSAFVSVASFKVSGVMIDGSAATIKDGTVADIQNGATVEVKGTLTAGVVKATTIEIKRSAVIAPPPPVSPAPPPPPSVAVAFEATGAISGFVSISNFTVAGVTIDASAATFKDGTAADLKNGAVIEVKGPLSGGIVRATTIEIKSTAVVVTPPPPPPPPSVAVAFEATGAISGFVSISSFKVSGATIDASAATFKDGTAADLVNGAVVEVKGTLTAGIVHATSVEIKSAPVPPSASVEFETTGAVSGFISVSSFQLSGKTIDASAASFERGTAADLRNGVQVEVKGTLSAGIVHAARVRFEK